MSKLHLHIVSPDNSSIGEITKDIYNSLRNRFIITQEIKQEHPRRKDILLCHFLYPTIVNDNIFNSFWVKILILPIDGTILTKEAINLINKFDVIITPASAGKNIMKNNGVIKPIKVIPNFFKKNLFNHNWDKEFQNFIDNETAEKFVFYHESTLHPRKGVDSMLTAYIEAFSDSEFVNDVVLLVKDSSVDYKSLMSSERMKRKIMRKQKKYKNPAKIIKLTQNLKQDELKYLWYRCNAYVSLAKMEGFGIPLLRMHILKKPIMVLDAQNSGYHDYLKEHNSYLVKSNYEFAQDEFMWLYDLKNTTWAEPILEDCSKKFLELYQDCLQNRQKYLSDETEYKDSYDKYFINNVMDKYAKVLADTYNNKIKKIKKFINER